MAVAPALGALLVLAALTPAPAAAAPPTIVPALQDGFQDVPVITGLSTPMAVRFAPGVDSRIFVADKSGVVLAFERPLDGSPTQVVDLSTETIDMVDRGMLGMALDPNFSTTAFMYPLYTRDAMIGGTVPRGTTSARTGRGDGAGCPWPAHGSCGCESTC